MVLRPEQVGLPEPFTTPVPSYPLESQGLLCFEIPFSKVSMCFCSSQFQPGPLLPSKQDALNLGWVWHRPWYSFLLFRVLCDSLQHLPIQGVDQMARNFRTHNYGVVPGLCGRTLLLEGHPHQQIASIG